MWLRHFGFINRGSITAAAEDNNKSTRAVEIGGVSTSSMVVIDNGIFNSGIITAQATSVSPGNLVSATALEIDSFATV